MKQIEILEHLEVRVTKLIYGSVALKHWFPSFPNKPNDIDYISKENKKTIDEQHYWIDSFQYILDNNVDDKYVDANFLYTIKISHASWDINWDKTMKHIAFMKKLGCVVDQTLYKMLYKEWEIIHGKKKVDLTSKNDKFFTGNITREYDHDWLHEFLAFGERPLHEKIRKNPESPLCSKELWDNLTHEDKCKCALEEIYVVATERFISKGLPTKTSKYRSMRNLITSMTKGYFNYFMLDNFEELLYNDDEYWIKKLKELK